ncbi:hypothetical protein AB0L44_38095 [Nonomuraea wenchangensis]|uniref:hypothetical protein n=1 Tax=Nonomuraea wenchangensis TaxID=568860 RepID=UPI0034405E65
MITAIGVPATMLRNAFYTSQIPVYTATGLVVGATGDGRISAATHADFATAAAAVLTSDDAESHFYELGGSSFSLAELAEEVTAITGTPVMHQNLSETDFIADRQAAGMDPCSGGGRLYRRGRDGDRAPPPSPVDRPPPDAAHRNARRAVAACS